MSPNSAAVDCTSFIATGFYNLDSLRFQKAPLDNRNEGWTEAWGASDLGDIATSWKIDEDAVSSLLATPHPQLPLVLTQYRPAWFEQLLLRMAKIPHIVTNSNCISNEATGPLPYLRDHKNVENPVLVGRHHPSNIAPTNTECQNSILDYLSSNRGVNLDSNLANDHQRSLSKCFIALIKSEIQTMILYLRFEDSDAWGQVYRNQCIHACSPGSESWVASLKGRFQASMERAVERRRLIEHSRRIKDIQEAIDRSKDALKALEDQLLSHNKPYLLGNDNPSLVDAVAWSCLAECLCDVHLIVVMAGFPRLIEYFKHIHKNYFGQVDADWKEWNKAQNMSNAFNQLPIDGKKNKIKSSFRDAIDLMQTLSLQNEEIQEVLNAAKEKRVGEPWPSPSKSTESLLYRWRMGDDFKQPEETSETDDNPIRKKMIRDQIRNDQIWISGAVGVSAVAILLLQSSAKKSK